MREFGFNQICLLLIVGLAFCSGVCRAAEGDAAKADRPTTEPAVISPLEKQIIFPGSQSQGQIGARIKPMGGCELLTLHAKDGTKIAALFGRSSAINSSGPTSTLIYSYGNGACMALSMFEFNQFRELGCNVIMTDYEGYGMSDGTPSEGGCYAAADAAYDYLLTRKDVDQKHIVAVGWSIGAAVAIDLAERRQVAGLATFSAFTNIAEMSAALAGGVPVNFLVSSRFDNLSKMAAIKCPIFMAHGTNDQLVPPEMLDRLSKAAKVKVTVVRVEGAGHNDIFGWGGDSLFRRVKGFLEGVEGVEAK